MADAYVFGDKYRTRLIDLLLFLYYLNIMKETNLKSFIHFITYDIWRITENEVSGIKQYAIRYAKTVILTFRGFLDDNIIDKASALTFNTLLAVVPLLAVLLAVADGFGIQRIVKEEITESLPGHEENLSQAFSFVDNYLKQTQGSIIIGVGLLLLFYTVISLINSIEQTINDLWHISKTRPLYRKVSDYLALFILLPIMITASSGLSIFVSTLQSSFLKDFVFLTPMLNYALRTAPFVIISFAFFAIYVLLPNTKVKIINALFAGILAGSVYQLFQFIYISGQIWVSRYNAIYGSFAALPLLLLWLQASWMIVLFGAKLAYVSQNVNKFSFERDTKSISRRYKDFVTLLIASLIVKRFEKNESPYTADELSESYRIPIRLTKMLLNRLIKLQIIDEVNIGEDERIVYYKPAMDIHQISVGYLIDKIDRSGSETFKIDIANTFQKEWEVILKTREETMNLNKDILLKDI